MFMRVVTVLRVQAPKRGSPSFLIVIVLLIVIIIGCFPPPRPLPASRPGTAITCTHLHSSTAIYGYLRLSTHKISDPRDGRPPSTNFDYLRLTATNCGFNKPKQSPPHGSRSAISVLSAVKSSFPLGLANLTGYD